MRKRRVDATTRVIARACLSGECGPAETCELLSPRLHWDKELVSERDQQFVERVASASSLLPVGKRLEIWHPGFVGPKLEILIELEVKVGAEVIAICERILQVMVLRRLEKKQ